MQRTFWVTSIGVVVSFLVLAGGAASLAGGPDEFGYAFRDSFSSGGPAFSFLSIAVNGTAVPGLPCDDCLGGPVPIGFPVTFYAGEVVGQYTDVYVSSNGFVTFTGGQSSGCCSGQALPNTLSPNNLVAGYWEDLNPNLGGSVRYRTVGVEPNRVFIVQFTSVQHFGGGNATTFQFKVFEATSNIEVHYSTAPTDGGTHSAGIENVTGLDGLSYRFGSFALSNTAVRYAFLKPDTDATLTGTVGDLGWFRSAVTVSLACTPPLGAGCEATFRRIDAEDPTIYFAYGGPFAVAADGDHHVDFFSRSTYGTVERPERETFRIDKTVPVVSAVAVCSVPLVNGFCPGTMTVTTSASDATSGLRSGQPSCTLDGAPVLCGVVPVATSGNHVFVVAAEDKAGNVASAKAIFSVDNDPPVLDIQRTCTVPGSSGWCRGPVQVKVLATDPVSGVAAGSPTCQRDSLPVACAGFTVSGDAVHTVAATALDRAGNQGAESVAVRIDATAPSASLTASCPLAGNAGWCRAPMTLQALHSDVTSGVDFVECTVDDAPVPCDSEVADEGERTAALRVRDVAGNEALDTLLLRVDTVPPAASITTFCAKAGSPGWCRAPSYAYQGKATDGGSGLASLACSVDNGAAPCTGTVAGEGLHTVLASAEDVAGNAAQAAKGLGIDSVPPTVAGTVTCTLPGNAGWCRGPVTFAIAAADATSGVAAVACVVDGADVECGLPYGLEGEHVFRATARDVAGNSAFDEVPFRIDATPPALDTKVSCRQGLAGWCVSHAIVGGGAIDPVSGVAAVACTFDGAASPCGVETDEAGPHTLTLAAEDVAGNKAQTAVSFRIDFGAPVGTLEAPLVATGPAQVPWAAADDTSGLALVEVQLRPNLGIVDEPWDTVCTAPASGAAAQGSCTVDAPPGLACYRLRITDVAGNVYLGVLLDLLDVASTPPRPTPSCGVSL